MTFLRSLSADSQRFNGTRPALTIIELLAALVLTSLLMAAVVGVLGSLAAQRRVLLDRRQPEAWKLQLSRQLRWDLQNARRLSVQENELRLIGFGGRDFISGVPTQRPAEIWYTIEEHSGRSWLVRREVHLDDRTNRNSRVELVCAGVTALDAWRLNEDDTLPEPKVPAETGGAPSLPRVPGSVRLVLYGVDRGSLLLDDVIYVRPKDVPAKDDQMPVEPPPEKAA